MPENHPPDESLDPSDVPYQTAPEYAERFGDMLGMDDHVIDEAVELARKYDLEEPLSHKPRTIAAGAIYWVGLLNNAKREQDAIADVADVHPATFSVAYRRIAREEGYEITPPAVDQQDSEDDNEGKKGFIEWLLTRFRGGHA